MAIFPIVIWGDPVLHTPAQPVTAFDDELKKLTEDMFETNTAAPGVGLAAPQIGLPLRLFVFDWVDPVTDIHHKGVAANPELWITPLPKEAPEESTDSEGCLSVPGERFPTKRAQKAILKAQDVEGKPYEMEAEGWLARIFQHEYDHINGVLYVDRLDFLNNRNALRSIAKSGWGKPGITWLPGVDNLEG